MKARLVRKLYRHVATVAHRYRYPGIVALVSWMLLVRSSSASAQTQPNVPAYWQYSASGQLHHVLPADINQDGVDEFIIADANGRIDLITASGKQQWSYAAPKPILAIATINTGGNEHPELEVLIGVANQLILLSSAGKELWRTQVTPFVASTPIVTGGAEEAAGDWYDESEILPSAIVPFDQQGDGQPEILVLLQSGHLLLFDTQGNLLWRQTDYATNPSDIPPRLAVFDFDQDGQDEILFSVFSPRRFGQLIMVDDGEIVWEIPLSGRVTGLVPISFSEDDLPLIAASTSLGQVHLYDHLRRQQWFRTLNRPATSLAVLPLAEGNALAVGTNVGSVVAFDKEGRRLWESRLAENANRKIVALSASTMTPPPDQPLLAATLEIGENVTNAADVILLGSNGQVFTRIADVDALGLTRFVDSNRDLNNELLIGHFATVELLGIGVGNSENVREWEYSLDAAPSATLVADLDGDGFEELIIGTQDGRIHSLNSNRTIRWLHDIGDAVTDLALLPHASEDGNDIVVVRHDRPNENEETATVELREAKGERIWEQRVETSITAILVGNVDKTGDPEIIVGTQDGRVIIFTADGERLWDVVVSELGGSIMHLLLLERNDRPLNEIIAAGASKLVGIDLADEIQLTRQIAAFDGRILDIYPVQESGNEELSVRLLVPTSDGKVHGLNWRGIEMAQNPWPQLINGAATSSVSTVGIRSGLQQEAPSLLMATNHGQLLQLDVADNSPFIPWQCEDLGEVSALHWRDQDNDGLPDLAVAGNEDGQVWIYSQLQTATPQLASAPLELSSSIFALNTLDRHVSQTPDLLAVSDNGLVQLFREQENRPPLLTDPVAETDQGQFSVSVAVNDAEKDEVAVQLEILDPEIGRWLAEDSQTVSNGNGTLFWPIASPPVSPDGLQYRFVFDDGSYQGTLVPPPGPPSIEPSPWASLTPAIFVVVTIAGLVFGIVFIRQAQTPTAQAGRFYRRLRQEPARSLVLLERKYIHTKGSPDFLLHLANRARQAEDKLIANLADGLFLLPERPLSGLSILDRTLEEIGKQGNPRWEEYRRWQISYRTSLAMLEAPSVTELSLLRPQLLQLLHLLETLHSWSPVFEILQPIITNLRDSERVDLTEDRLVYLNEAATGVRQAQDALPDYSPSIEHTVVTAIVRRWSGLVSAEIEDLRGRAQLAVKLKTKRVVPSEQTVVALDIHNSGRAAAENVIAMLDEDPAYEVLSPPQVVPFIPPGHTREVRFTIEPQVIDRFRISLSLTYDDRNHQDMDLAFGDMVHLLPPVRDFSPITNPYMPGTPLRPGSTLFFGREDLFDFIAENAGYRAFRNVLILVGQRRTGKTSALLRLEEHLPPHLLPVYIDCQSLGVIPGMPALLEELAWYIADALARYEITVEVPGLEQWQQDPTHLFQRRFLPQAKAHLPPDTTLLLVFDEFEAFENLVAEGILPSTFFTYLRHLMQHGDQLNFIFVGTRRLEEMTTDYWSVLFNIALYRKIDFLNTAAATRLITEPVAPKLIYDDLALDKILRVTAGHPYFLQLVCYTLVKRANTQRTGYVTISDVNAAVDEMLSLGEVHFAYLWQRSTPTERALLTAVAHLMDRNASFYPEDLLRYLEPYAVQPDPAAVTAALNRLVERDILREVTEEGRALYELKLGLVGLWVAQNKSLSKLFAGNGSNGFEKPLGEAVGS